MKVQEFLNKDSMTLDKLSLGKSARVTSIGGNENLRRHFFDMGLTPNTQVLTRKTAPLGDPIEIHLRGYELTLRKEDAKKILVERI